MSFEYYTPQQQKVLEALAEYRFLTVQQMVEIGISKSATSLRDNVLKPLVTRHRSPVTYQDVGKALGTSYVWSLTRKGAKDLSEAWSVELEKVPYPKGGVSFSTQYWHRLAQVGFHLRLNQWADHVGANVTIKEMDYVMVSSQKRGGHTPQTKVSLASGNYIIPDGVFGFELGGHHYLYVLEVHHGTSTKKVVTKLQTYFEALAEHTISRKYDFELSCYILSVFQEEHFNKDRKLTREQKHFRDKRRCEAKMKNVMDRLDTDSSFTAFKPAYLFNTMENIRSDIRQGWMLSDCRSATPF